MSRTDRQQQRRDSLWAQSPACCWCLEATELGRGPHGQPLPRTATLEHPQSRHHPAGRSDLSQTRLSHYDCNRRVNRIEGRAVASLAQSEADIAWLRQVAAAHAESGTATELRPAIARLLALASRATRARRPPNDIEHARPPAASGVCFASGPTEAPSAPLPDLRPTAEVHHRA